MSGRALWSGSPIWTRTRSTPLWTRPTPSSLAPFATTSRFWSSAQRVICFPAATRPLLHSRWWGSGRVDGSLRTSGGGVGCSRGAALLLRRCRRRHGLGCDHLRRRHRRPSRRRPAARRCAGLGARGGVVGQAAFSFAGFLMAFVMTRHRAARGTLSDAFGRKRVFQLGLLLFVVSCILIALSSSGGAVIAGRVIQGAAGATILAADSASSQWPTRVRHSCARCPSGAPEGAS